MTESDQREKQIFNDAMELASVEAREAYLQKACAGDEQLRRRVAALVEATAAAEGFLPHRTAVEAESVSASPVTDGPGDSIGRYKLLEQIGEGGCGMVYLAEQREPVRRRVALKVIKLGMDTKQVIARFEAERQALALMDHPNIAKVFDAGATETGRPYFVMELVRGIKITDFCDRNNLSTRERLDLFIQVCRAIQHAHQKGIIHRDIKPSNVLVTVNDGVPVPKVIDFGIAKATTQQRLTDKTLYTAFAQFIGTPAYMSPEQAVMTSLDIDTRSDIYSLGVLLYELLTSKTPFDQKTLIEAGLEGMQRIIRENEPARPSTRLGTLGAEEQTTVARKRGSEPPKLIRLIRGDLDWIVMKCLEKDRNRRYDTANMLALDLTRHLDNEPIVARPPSVAYELRKFIWRHKSVLGITGILVFLATALLASTLLLFKEWRAAKYTAVTVESDPQGAEVWHGGRMLGLTPFKMSELPPGAFTYTLVLTNFEAVTNTATIEFKKHISDLTFLRPVQTHGAGTVLGPGMDVRKSIAVAALAVTILDVQGTVRVARKGSMEWLPAEANMVLTVGDRLRTDRDSRATVRASDPRGTVRFGERTELEILPCATDSNPYHILTPNGSFRIRG